ncbi:MAG: hypothetical protein LBI98_00745 [Endomicrobium sp.]|nr:hypothetical protein [Endomicrobium sp.]
MLTQVGGQIYGFRLKIKDSYVTEIIEVVRGLNMSMVGRKYIHRERGGLEKFYRDWNYL